MTCEQRPNRLASWAANMAAVSAMSNKRGFYAGLALAAGGLLGAGLVAAARRLSRPGQPSPAAPRPTLANLPAPVRVPVQSAPGAGERCARCGASGAAKKGGWYRISGRSLCQDCAPQASRQAGVELAAASLPAPGWSGSPPLAAGLAQTRPGLSPAAGYLLPEKRVAVDLHPSPIRLNVGHQPDGQPAWFVVRQGYVVLKTNGQDTGLALTPAVQIGPRQPDGSQDVTEDTGQWLITHIPSGKSLGNRAFNDLDSARQLAGVLAQLDWTREERQIPAREVNRVNQTFWYYSQALEQARTKSGTRRGPLTGQLIADNVGGLARVLADQGARLFVADSYGQRYELDRSEARKPQENDFRLARIALPLEPGQHKDTRCRGCGAQATESIGAGQSWYRMDYQDFCPPCAAAFADHEGYELPEAVGRL